MKKYGIIAIALPALLFLFGCATTAPRPTASQSWMADIINESSPPRESVMGLRHGQPETPAHLDKAESGENIIEYPETVSEPEAEQPPITSEPLADASGQNANADPIPSAQEPVDKQSDSGYLELGPGDNDVLPAYTLAMGNRMALRRARLPVPAAIVWKLGNASLTGAHRKVLDDIFLACPEGKTVVVHKIVSRTNQVAGQNKKLARDRNDVVRAYLQSKGADTSNTVREGHVNGYGTDTLIEYSYV